MFEIVGEFMNYPNEIVSLPSSGIFYPPNHPLSNGLAEVRLFSAYHEEILCNSNLSKKGKSIEWVLKDIIADKTIDTNSILKCDINGILVASKILSFGPKYPVKINCPSCQEAFDFEVDLMKLNNPDLDFSTHERGNPNMSFELPHSKHIIIFKLETYGMDKNIKAGSSIDLYKNIIVSIDGNTDQTHINNFIENEFLSKDSIEFRTFIKHNTPQMNLCFNAICQHCNETIKIDQSITPEFFGFPPEYKLQLHDEIFSLCNYSHGFVSEQVYSMPTSLRKFYLKRLMEAKEAEKKSMEKSQGGVAASPEGIARPNIQRKK